MVKPTIGIYHFSFVSCSANLKIMSHLLLNAFYDTVNKSVGPTLMWVFLFLMLIELIYVMAKYVISSDTKEDNK